ncbi:MAG: hypothetical protein Roseis2KO_09710 [Roseivirga sp.]
MFLTLVATSSLQAQNDGFEVFLPGLISTDKIEYYTAFTPDGNTVYFVRRDAVWGDFNDKTPGYIYHSERKAGKWSEPEVSGFSGVYADGAPFISDNGDYFFFTSKRPQANKATIDTDIWFMRQTNSGWSTPTPLEGDINSDKTEFSPVLTNSGNLYFASMRDGGFGQGDIYVCEFRDGACSNVQNLGKQINSAGGEWNVLVDAEETYMIFEASGRIAGKNNGDFYISFRENGQWQKAIYMDALNTEGSDLAARLSPDGETLYFAQSKDGEVDIKSVSIEMIEQYRNK